MLPHSLLALPPLVGRSGVLDGGLAREHRAHRERVSRLKGSRIGWIAEDQGRLRTARSGGELDRFDRLRETALPWRLPVELSCRP